MNACNFHRGCLPRAAGTRSRRPRDAATGLATGRRQHKPLTIVKTIDKATPLLYRALAFNENLSSVVLSLVQDPADPTAYFTITLENANIANVHDSSVGPQHLEEVSFTYQKITWTYVDGSITFEDDWNEPTL